MRPIEFRGMRADNKEWVYGYLAEKDVINIPIHDETTGYHGYDDVLIIPETVGELVYIDELTGQKYYTGDKDKYGDVLMYNKELALFAMHSYYSVFNKWSPSSYPIDFSRVKIIGTIYDTPPTKPQHDER